MTGVRKIRGGGGGGDGGNSEKQLNFFFCCSFWTLHETNKQTKKKIELIRSIIDQQIIFQYIPYNGERSISEKYKSFYILCHCRLTSEKKIEIYRHFKKKR